MHRLELRADLAPLVREQAIVAWSIGPESEALLLLVDRELAEAPFGRDDSTGPSFPLSQPRRGYPATWLRCQGQQVLQRVDLPEVELAFPLIEALPGGEILLAGARCHYRDGDPERNAVVFGPDGRERRRFVLGDGLRGLGATPDGRLWAAYFDEGIFGNYGWSEPLGGAGLVCFDLEGRVVWEFMPPEGFGHPCDCYAFNVAGPEVWACYYTDFPVVRIDSTHRVEGWLNDVEGANALVTDGRRVLLWGGYGEFRTRAVLLELEESVAVEKRRLRLERPNGESLEHAEVVGRGSTLHALAGNRWYAWDLKGA